MIPIIRPKVAPTAIDGTKIPAGTLQPYETTTKPTRMTVARKSELIIVHWNDVLSNQMNVVKSRLTAHDKRRLTCRGCRSRRRYHTP